MYICIIFKYFRTIPAIYYDKNLSTGPTLYSLRLAGKEAILRCVSSSGSMSWYLQNYSDFTAEELNPI